MVNSTLQPLNLISSVYGATPIFIARSSPNASRWLPQSALERDMATASMLTVLGDMPIVCAASVSTPDALSLLRDAGFQSPKKIYRYADVKDYRRILHKFFNDGLVMVTQHVHPLSEMPPEYCWIAPPVLSFLNNKANLENLVPKENVPFREIVSVDQIVNSKRKWMAPVVIKAVTDESTGGGIDVRICLSGDDVKKAASYFADCCFVVCEEWMDIRRNLCLHYSITNVGNITYLGFTEQVSDDRGAYCGNWLEDGTVCPVDAVEVGASIVRTAYEHGYYGIVGIDMAVWEEQPCKVFDLNFRANGSTPAILYSQSIYRNHQKPVIRLRRLKGSGNYRDMLNSVYRAMTKGILLPLGSCDPEKGNYVEKHPLLTGMILGETRQDVLENERELASMGLDI
jgi:hypothetical protein